MYLKIKLLFLVILSFCLINCKGKISHEFHKKDLEGLGQSKPILLNSLKQQYELGQFNKVADYKSKITELQDSDLYIISLCKLGRFLEVEKSNPELLKYKVYFGILYPDSNIFGSHVHTPFHYSIPPFSSYQLHYMANYYFLKYQLPIPEYEYLLRESIKKDSSNSFTLYDYAKSCALATNYGRAAFLLRKCLEKENNWESAKNMLNDCNKKYEDLQLTIKYHSIKEVITNENGHLDYDNSFEKY